MTPMFPKPPTRVRSQAAVVRALRDEVEHLVPGSRRHHAASEQLAEELARLGHEIVDDAASLGGAA